MKQYLDIVREVLDHGERRDDRTGVGTLSLFGMQARYDLRDGLPLVTTKRVNFKAVVLELLWFLRGETNINTLGCGIWSAWAKPDGDIGPMYGAAWRRLESVDWDSWGDVRPLSKVTDQIAQVVEAIRTNPYSRRHVVSAWNVGELPNMVLAPCHALFQFNCTSDGHLDLQLYQRSADLGLGVPWNIVSYSLLLEMVAMATGRKARYFIHTLGDAHVYLNHVDGLREQLTREPRPLPRVTITKMPDFSSAAAWNITPDDIVIDGYDPWPAIKLPIAV